MKHKTKTKNISDLFNKKKTKQKSIQDIHQVQDILKKPTQSYNHHDIVYTNTTHTTHTTNTTPNNTPNANMYSFHENKSLQVPFNLSLENDYKMISKTFNPNISVNDIHTHISMDNTIGSFIYQDIDNDDTMIDAIDANYVERIRKKGIRTIVHVYQANYKHDIHCTGFGDFIRSCFFIVQFCMKFHFDYKIIVNHPIANFLEYFRTMYKKIKTNIQIQTQFHSIQMFTENNFIKSEYNANHYIQKYILSGEKVNDFVDYICQLPISNHTVYSYNIFFPYNEAHPNIHPILCNEMRSFFHPTKEIEQQVDSTLQHFSLLKHSFIVLHIRSGDKYLNDKYKLFDTQYFKNIRKEIHSILHSFTNSREKNIMIGKHILLIADNNEIKLLLQKEFPFIKFLMNDITHTGENIVLEQKKLQNTMVDFFLMSNASFIYSFTIYPHGSGFSYWCAKMYDIPYQCKWIE